MQTVKTGQGGRAKCDRDLFYCLSAQEKSIGADRKTKTRKMITETHENQN